MRKINMLTLNLLLVLGIGNRNFFQECEEQFLQKWYLLYTCGP